MKGKDETEKLANVFQTEHREGTVSNVTSYSFKYTTTSKKETEKQKEVVYMRSYFLDI